MRLDYTDQSQAIFKFDVEPELTLKTELDLELQLCNEHILDLICGFDAKGFENYLHMWLQPERLSQVVNIKDLRKVRNNGF